MDAGSNIRLMSMYLKSAFLAMEPADCLIQLARQFGGGSISAAVQLFILEHCINNFGDRGTGWNHRYIRNTLKKVITAAESSCDEVLEGLYTQFIYYVTLHMEDDLLKDSRVCKRISFLFPDGQESISSGAVNLMVKLQCSLNMLEGDTGCALWPSSLFLSEFILSHPEIFASKICFEVGAGVGLVGVTLSHVGASKVILTDGDLSSIENLKNNLELNQLNTEAEPPQTCEGPKSVECKHMSWESASEDELQSYHPDIILGADIIYNPLCMSPLVRVLSTLLNPVKSCPPELKPSQTYGYCTNQRNERELKLSQTYDYCRNESKLNFSELKLSQTYDYCRNESELKLSQTYDYCTNRRNESENDISKEAPIAYIATVIRNQKTFDYFLKLAGESNLSVSDITETSKTLNLLPYMLSYDRSSVHLYKVCSSHT